MPRRAASRLRFSLFAFLIVPLAAAANANEAGPVRLAGGVSGHIHPAVCVAKDGTLVVIFGQADMRDLRQTRSTDGGRTWSEPTPFPPTVGVSIYPGSLTALKDGRIVHAWNVWYPDPPTKGGKSRYVSYSVSSDAGKTWGEPKSLAKNPASHSVIRHPLVELSENEWLVSLTDRTIVYDPQTGKESPFGDGRVHGLEPIVRTPAGTFVSGTGVRSTDGGKTWEKVTPFPKIGDNGWRFDLACLNNGWLVAGEVTGSPPSFGGTSWHWLVSRDDGKSWDAAHPVEFYNPGREIGG